MDCKGHETHVASPVDQNNYRNYLFLFSVSDLSTHQQQELIQYFRKLWKYIQVLLPEFSLFL